MRIVTTGAKEQLVSRIQCMRDVAGVLDSQLDILIAAKIECSGTPQSMRFSNNDVTEYGDGENSEDGD